jgi:hypothetical protein
VNSAYFFNIAAQLRMTSRERLESRKRRRLGAAYRDQGSAEFLDSLSETPIL